MIIRPSARRQRGYIINPYAFGVGTSDPYFSSVALLLHFNGTNGSTTITDSSSHNIACSVVGGGNHQLNTSTYKYGSASVASVGSYVAETQYVSCTHDASQAIGTSDFTIEGWIYRTAERASYYQGFISKGNWNISSQRAFSFDFLSGNLQFRLSSTGSAWTTSDSFAWTPSLNTWYHLAVARAGTSMRCFVNGTQVGVTKTNSVNVFSTTAPVNLFSGAGGCGWQGYMDDWRFTVGVARYTGNFVAPTAEFPNS